MPSHRFNAVLAVSIVLLSAWPTDVRAQHEEHQHAGSTGASSVSITGVVLCADGPPLPGAVVQLFAIGDLTGVARASTISDATGRFNLAARSGNYRLRISYLGHVGFEKNADVETGAGLNVGSVRLAISAIEFDALVATAEKDRVRLSAGETVFDATKSATSAGGTIADALRKVPGLETTPDGKLSMRGNANVVVLMNGQRTVLKDEALVAFLNQMPASALERIEAATSVGAVQDADGSGGLVNLVFRDDASGLRPTYSLAASGATAQQYTASASTAGGAGRLTWDASYSFSSKKPETTLHTMRDNWLAQPALQTSHQLSSADAEHRLHAITLGSGLRVGATHSVAVRGAYSWMRGVFDNQTDFADISSSGSRTGESLLRSTLTHTIPTVDASLSWRYRGAGRRRLSLSLNARGGGGIERFDGMYQRDLSSFSTSMRSRRSEFDLENSGSLDAFGARFTFGHKLQQRDVSASYEVVEDQMRQESFTHGQTINALFTSASRVTGRFYVEAGVRAENESRDVAVNGSRVNDRGNQQLFPSLQLHWPHEPTGKYQYHIAYARRIDRPEPSMLNPFSMGEDDMNAFIGSPYLRPEIVQQVEFGIRRASANTTVVLTPFARTSENPIRPIKAVTESGRTTTSLQNLDRATAAGIDLSSNLRLRAWATASLAASVYYLGVTGNDGVYVNARAALDARITERSVLQLFVTRSSSQPVEQGEILANTTTDLAVAHRFGRDERGTLTLRISDPFNSSRLAFKVGDPTFTQYSERRTTSRAAALSFSWAVGQERESEPARAGKESRIF